MSVMLHGHACRRVDAEAGEITFDLDIDKIVSFDFGKLSGKA
jgi:hypothetical protein